MALNFVIIKMNIYLNIWVWFGIIKGNIYLNICVCFEIIKMNIYLKIWVWFGIIKGNIYLKIWVWFGMIKGNIYFKWSLKGIIILHYFRSTTIKYVILIRLNSKVIFIELFILYGALDECNANILVDKLYYTFKYIIIIILCVKREISHHILISRVYRLIYIIVQSIYFIIYKK